MNIKIQVSGRNLLKKGLLRTGDPYYILKLSEDGGESKTEIGRSETLQNQLNPDWPNVFEITFDREKNQYLYFHVWDEDTLREDDTLGRVWVNVADFVDKGQMDTPNLDKAGYLIIKNADGDVGPGVMRSLYDAPESETLQFMLSASGLPTKDDVGLIPMKGDPYVTVEVIEGPDGSATEIGRTSTVSSTSNPDWGDVLTVEWNKALNQRLHFKVYDDDFLRSDDHLGQGWMQLNDYVGRGQVYTVLLLKYGRITIRKA
ncbi:unnamed protein product [Orchesella dallaii]|uniref:C2 domain-containing protein n=1 Tax=Orchesella dallaii TaxID=48710 RepID=A0ABP1S9B4_9HEXA